MNKKNTSVLIVGVGGQGILLAGKILSEGLLTFGYDVKMSEIHGMAQRGGSVSSHIRYGEKVFSPVIDRGRADLIVAFEKVEALRWLPWLSPEGTLLVNNEEIYSMPVILGRQAYPDRLEEVLPSLVPSVKVLEASKIAREAGEPRGANMVLLGGAVALLGLNERDWGSILDKGLPSRGREKNKEAFARGVASLKA
ncbi:MAG: indolepyruvate oxidoreductase subunit beta [Synergistaceae bacterium]|nr:indolepyruvate oxidoreductase subunit beta [Synergistaceae bacterium]